MAYFTDNAIAIELFTTQSLGLVGPLSYITSYFPILCYKE